MFSPAIGSVSHPQALAGGLDERRQIGEERDAVARADDLDVAPAPEAAGAADEQPAAAGEQPELEQRDRGLRVRGEVHGDQRRALLALQLPLDLAAKRRVVDALLP